MDYKESIEYLYRQLPMFSRVGAAAYKPGLDTSLRLDEFFGHPHRRFKSIHVAGTNGKGSCSHCIAAVLQSMGYKTALYTSPHLVDFRERMRINGDMIPEENVADFVNRFVDSGYDGHPSFFELTMMMAFDWFASERVDFAVIETGMGGRLDSTNIITPIGCVITNISNDHTQFLGDTLPKIAGEKAGIIKPGIPVVIGEAEGDVRRVFEEKAESCGSRITFAEEEMQEMKSEHTPDGWNIITPEGIDFTLPLPGDYQLHNIKTTLSALAMLRREGIGISDNAIRHGLNNVCDLTHLMGRWMKLGDKPLTIADTGHNEAGLSHISGQLKRLMSERPENARLRMVIGFVADKDIDHILPLLPAGADYYLTKAQIPRAMAVEELEKHVREAGLGSSEAGGSLRTFPTVAEAYAAATADAAADDIVYIGGSTFVVADHLASLKK